MFPVRPKVLTSPFMAASKRSRDTVRGYGTSDRLERESAPAAQPPVAEPPPGEPEPTAAATSGDIEIDYFEEEGPPKLLEGRWRAYEVWTGQHIYVLADDLVCLEVIDRRSGKADPDNEIAGARLVGGELRDSAGLIRQVSHPLPQRGARAVFARSVGDRQRMSETTEVTRVVLRQRVVSIASPSKKRPSWRDITGRHDLP